MNIFMNAYFFKALTLLMIFYSLYANGSNLSDDARDRGIDETCSSYLSQIEKSYNFEWIKYYICSS